MSIANGYAESKGLDCVGNSAKQPHLGKAFTSLSTVSWRRTSCILPRWVILLRAALSAKSAEGALNGRTGDGSACFAEDTSKTLAILVRIGKVHRALAGPCA
jgi:hypothetical protein